MGVVADRIESLRLTNAAQSKITIFEIYQPYKRQEEDFTKTKRWFSGDTSARYSQDINYRREVVPRCFVLAKQEKRRNEESRAILPAVAVIDKSQTSGV